MGGQILTISHAAKAFGGNEVLKDISLGVSKGDVLAIIGPSVIRQPRAESAVRTHSPRFGTATSPSPTRTATGRYIQGRGAASPVISP